MNAILSFLKGLVDREAARLVAYAGGAATAAAVFIAGQFGVELSAEFIAGVSVFAGVVMTEAIRLFVNSNVTLERAKAKAVADAQETP